MQDRYVFIVLGFLGSGKSYVSRWLTPYMHAVYLRVDDLRLAMFGADRPELYTPENKALVNNASRYTLMQILKSRQASVIYDANNNSRELRRETARQATEFGATAIVVWVQTPLEVAKERTEIRKVTESHELFAPNLVEKMAKLLEEPDKNEVVITIDGLASADEQQKSFAKQLAAIKAR